MKTLKIFLLLLATILMATVMYFVRDASIVDMIAATYAICINGFLGVDLAAMIKDSSKKPIGEYKAIKLYRYVLAFLCMGSLFILALYMKETYGIQAITAISAFGSGTMLIIGLVMGGLEGNKIASRGGPKDVITS